MPAFNETMRAQALQDGWVGWVTHEDVLKVQLKANWAVRAQGGDFGGSVAQLMSYIDELPPTTTTIKFCFNPFHDLGTLLGIAAITIVEAYRQSTTATKLEVTFDGHFQQYDNPRRWHPGYWEFLNHAPCQETITKVSFCNLWNRGTFGIQWQNIAALGNLQKMQSLEFRNCSQAAGILSHLSQVVLSNTCRDFAIWEELTAEMSIEDGEDGAELDLVRFLQNNNRIDCLSLGPVSVNATRIIATQLENMKKLGRLTWRFQSWSQEQQRMVSNHTQIAHQTSLFHALGSTIELSQGLQLHVPLDLHTLQIVQFLAQNMTKGNRQLAIHDTAEYTDLGTENLFLLLDAAVGANSESNLQDFSLDIPCFSFRPEQVAEHLERVLSSLSPHLQKLQLVFSTIVGLGGDFAPLIAFQTRVLEALEQNMEVLNLHTLDVSIIDSSQGGQDVIDQATKQKFHDFVVAKSMQWSKATTEDDAFRLEDLPKALDLVQSNPHLDTSLHSLSLVFHCLRSDADAAGTLQDYLERSATKRKCEGGSDSLTEELLD